jgi:rod shape-determining protein MreD
MRAVGAFLVGVVVVLLLRSTALSAFAARGVVLDALAFAVVAWSLRHGPAWGCTFGFALGLCADLDAAHWPGRHALVLTLVGYAVGRLAGTVVRESAGTQFALVLGATAIHQAWSSLFELQGWSATPQLLARVGIAALATAVTGAAILMIARRVVGGPLFGNVSVQPGQAR